MEVVSNLRPSKFLAQCSTQRQSTLKFRRTLSQITSYYPENEAVDGMSVYLVDTKNPLVGGKSPRERGGLSLSK